MPDYKEVTITITEGEELAQVWTNIRTWKTRLLKLGAKPLRETDSGSSFTVPAAYFWPRRRRGQGPAVVSKTVSPTQSPRLTAARLEALSRARAAQRAKRLEARMDACAKAGAGVD